MRANTPAPDCKGRGVHGFLLREADVMTILDDHSGHALGHLTLGIPLHVAAGQAGEGGLLHIGDHHLADLLRLGFGSDAQLLHGLREDHGGVIGVGGELVGSRAEALLVAGYEGHGRLIGRLSVEGSEHVHALSQRGVEALNGYMEDEKCECKEDKMSEDEKSDEESEEEKEDDK